MLNKIFTAYEFQVRNGDFFIRQIAQGLKLRDKLLFCRLYVVKGLSDYVLLNNRVV